MKKIMDAKLFPPWLIFLLSSRTFFFIYFVRLFVDLFPWFFGHFFSRMFFVYFIAEIKCTKNIEWKKEFLLTGRWVFESLFLHNSRDRTTFNYNALPRELSSSFSVTPRTAMIMYFLFPSLRFFLMHCVYACNPSLVQKPRYR